MIKASLRGQDLRRKISLKAKAEPAWRVWGRSVPVGKLETRGEAYPGAKAPAGAPGIDGVTGAAVEQGGVAVFLEPIRVELRCCTDRPLPNRKPEIPKDGGTKVRGLSMPALRARVVRGARKLILEPICEADCQAGSVG
jgi:RNA-directed DNA polymerase